VFLIEVGGELGTAFTIEVKETQYLITAKHVLSGLKGTTGVNIARKSNWESVSISNVWYAPDSIDLAVLFITKPISPTFPVTVSSIPFLSQDSYFLGFPFGMQVHSFEANNGYPIPFVRKGIIAGFFDMNLPTMNYILDATNNPGFSGGPVFTVSSDNVPELFAVVKGYEAELSPVKNGNKDTSLHVETNTGLVRCTSLHTAIEMLNALKK